MLTWTNAQRFVELALALEPHMPGYVDSYFGPEEIREQIKAKGTIPLEELSEQAADLLHTTRQDGSLSRDRRTYLLAELTAMQTTLRILRGEALDFLEESKGLYGLSPQWTDEKVFEEAHQALDDLYPGTGTLAERRSRFLEKTIIPSDKLIAIIRNLAEEFQERTKGTFNLPEDESCDFAAVNDAPWTAYNWYLGGYRSRIEINTDLPIFAGYVPHLVAHEAYAGHHTEHAIKEQILFHEKGLLEHSILLVNTPSCVACEGIAENALDILVTEDELLELFQRVLQEAGIDEVSAEQLVRIRKVGRPLNRVGVNRALMLHARGASEDEVIAYGIRYALMTEERSRKSMAFLTDPLWRSYVSLYALGYELVDQYLGEGETRVKRFQNLLQEPVTTSQLMES